MLLAAAMSWSYSATLGFLFAACASGRFSFDTLRLPGVVSVSLVSSTVIAIAMTPIALWSVRTGAKNLCIYGPILWVVLAAYILVLIPRTGAHSPYGLLLLGVVGLVVLGLIPRAPKVA
jgi:hypothetical protein